MIKPMERFRFWGIAAISFLPVIALVAAPLAYALSVPPPSGINTIPSPPLQSTGDVTDLICGLIPWIFWGLIVLSIVMVLIAAYRYVTSGGDAEKVSSANKTILYAAIAVVVALMAAGVPLIVDSFLSGGANSADLGNTCSIFG